MVGIGIWGLADKTYMNELVGSTTYTHTAGIFIGVGIIIIILSVLGGFGALKEVKCMLITVGID